MKYVFRKTLLEEHGRQSYHSDEFEIEATLRQLPQKVTALHCLHADGTWKPYPDFHHNENHLTMTCTLTHGQCRIFKLDYSTV